MSAGERGFTVLSRGGATGRKLAAGQAVERPYPVVHAPEATRIAHRCSAAPLLTASIGVVFVLVLSTYVLWAITSPLSLFATAAEEFGRSLKDSEPLRETARDRQDVHVLNTMRSRIVSLIEERTSVLVAIGHDLRTPLTRIVLQAERACLSRPPGSPC